MLSSQFQKRVLDTLFTGLSALDLPSLHIHDMNSAEAFAKAYGFDLKSPTDVEELWGYHRRAITFLREELLEPSEKLPEQLSDPAQLGNIGQLLIYASQKNSDLQKYACSTLKIMHVLVHLSHDLFSLFSDEIRQQILNPIKAHIVADPMAGATTLGQGSAQIKLQNFELKPFKTSSSSMLKLLSKANLVALNLLDRVGVRFVTRNVTDVFRVAQYLINENLIAYAHIIPDQSNNTLYPVNLFFEVVEKHRTTTDPEVLEQALMQRLLESSDRAEFNTKENLFTAKEYRFIKFICRKLIRVDLAGRQLNFFYPFEVQIVPYDSHLSQFSGPAAHSEYKKRQREAARLRVF